MTSKLKAAITCLSILTTKCNSGSRLRNNQCVVLTTTRCKPRVIDDEYLLEFRQCRIIEVANKGYAHRCLHFLQHVSVPKQNRPRLIDYILHLNSTSSSPKLAVCIEITQFQFQNENKYRTRQSVMPPKKISNRYQTECSVLKQAKAVYMSKPFHQVLMSFLILILR